MQVGVWVSGFPVECGANSAIRAKMDITVQNVNSRFGVFNLELDGGMCIVDRLDEFQQRFLPCCSYKKMSSLNLV